MTLVMASYCLSMTCNYDILFPFYSKDYDDKIFSLESTKTKKSYDSLKDEKNI